MWQQQIAIALEIIGLFSILITSVLNALSVLKPAPQRDFRVKEPQEEEPNDESWWRDIFEYYD